MIRLFEKQYIAILLIIGISLAVFYPTLNSNVIDLDDTTMILDLNNPDKYFSAKKMFWKNTIGCYYRPLLMLSFIIDSKTWAFEYSGYHLTNIVLHLFNALILYFIAVAFFKGKRQFKVVSFFLSIAFVLNPLTIESVAWISGRTDILATFFSLSSFFFYISKIRFRSVFVSISFLLGLFAKENAVCMFIIIVLSEFVICYPSKGFKVSLIRSLKWAGILSTSFFIYFYFRFAGFGLLLIQEQIQALPIQGLHLQDGVSLRSQMISGLFALPAAIAFYLKKLVCPFPLNFAISQINLTLYSIGFVIIGIISLTLVLKRKFYYPFWILLFIISFSPALPVALGDVAWTRFAERYLYLSVPVICLFAGDLYYKKILKYPERTNIIKTIAVSILIIFCIGSIQRIHVWKDKKSLWEDTYKKNPFNGKVLYKYGSVLSFEEGLPFFKKAVKISRDSEWRDFSLLIVAQDEANKLNYNKAYDLIQEALKINSERQNCYQAAGILKQIIKDESLREDKYNRLLIQCYQLAYKKKPEPVDLLNIIRIFESLNDDKNAEKYSKMLIEKFPRSRAAKYILSKFNN
ncbi:tetratricopeptide repeat protein [Desulfobacula phenolica]|uniref:Dolichyl-phosphate-mannose-protein mannosyltransferase n=1 Tax=Desulfobacula phenolica TaxID=90732 RepID=A0A1H2JWE5_9BACT|nr:hypothetical protein [Desulfobacula phenolica]SDU60541.1 hypothetical protein SAMN04487931_11643 [Desulfobacula phenolica]